MSYPKFSWITVLTYRSRPSILNPICHITPQMVTHVPHGHLSRWRLNNQNFYLFLINNNAQVWVRNLNLYHIINRTLLSPHRLGRQNMCKCNIPLRWRRTHNRWRRVHLLCITYLNPINHLPRFGKIVNYGWGWV